MLGSTVLEAGSLVGIVRFHEGGDVSGTLAALVRGGIEQVEVTIDTPGALDAVAAAAAEGRTVGIGTVVDSEQVTADELDGYAQWKDDADGAYLDDLEIAGAMMAESMDLGSLDLDPSADGAVAPGP